MPRLVSLQPAEVIGVTLDHFGWRIGYSTTTWDDMPCLSISFWYETQSPFVIAPTMANPVVDVTNSLRLALLKCPAPVAASEGVPALEPVLRGMRAGGSLDADTRRMTEAFTLFKNLKVKQELIDSCVADAAKMVAAYWELRTWLASGCRDPFKHETLNTVIVGTP